MPTSSLALQGSLTLQTPMSPTSAAQSIAQQIGEVMYASVYDAQSPSLTTDGAQAIPFPIGMTSCNFVYMKVQGGSPVDLIITSADGTAQVIPVDSIFIASFNTKPLTAISVQRTAGVQATLTYVIAQNA